MSKPNTPPASLEEYLELLKAHDWSYEYSDDHTAYKRGLAQRNLIVQSAATLDPELVHYSAHRVGKA